MDLFLLILALVPFLFWVPNALEMLIGIAVTPRLEQVPPLPPEECPTLSIVVPACNEAGTIEPAMRSLLTLDYPGLEILAVEDRSTDATGAILDRLAAENPRLRVLHVTELPKGWLGKNHALHHGAGLCRGEYILFTDADVHFAPDALRRAMALVRRAGCDHLVAFPHVLLEGFWEKAFFSFFLVMFNFRFRPWEAPWAWAPGYAGVGAFSLLRASAYGSIGGHGRLPMEVGDDIKLGKVVKRAGFRQCLASAPYSLSVRWVVGLRGIVHGLEKNGFAGLRYSWPAAVAAILGMFASTVWPFAGAWIGPVLPRALCAAALAAMLALNFAEQRETRIPFVYFLAWPLAAALFSYTLVRSALKTQRQGGIYWRGTFYALDELRRGCV
jgi:cellulose synthase/poly-beta-1,6-N-acetylglucosamine synthase-like glycosyltransferase